MPSLVLLHTTPPGRSQLYIRSWRGLGTIAGHLIFESPEQGESSSWGRLQATAPLISAADAASPSPQRFFRLSLRALPSPQRFFSVARLLTILLAKVGKRVGASGRGRKAFLERRTLFALLGGQTALLLMFLCPSDYPRFAFP